MNTFLHRRATSRAGFSLAELMVVIVIIGLLATVVVTNVLPKIFTAQEGTAKASIMTLVEGLDTWATEHNGRYPDSLEALLEKDENGYSIIKAETVPKDPWGNEFLYEPPGRGSAEPRVYTLGADGAPGGEGKDKDIDNFMIRSGEV